MLGTPSPTDFDLNFRVFRIPVRVSIWFWLGCVLLGPKQPREILIWAGCLFGSILIHELGHGLTSRFFGDRPRIVLHGMGGVCISDDAGRETFGQRLTILLMGPGRSSSCSWG